MTRSGADPRDRDYIGEANATLQTDLGSEYAQADAILARRGIDIEAVTAAVAGFGVAIPSWGVGTGGTRFARFPGPR